MTVMTGAGSSTLGVGIAYWLLLCTAFAPTRRRIKPSATLSGTHIRTWMQPWASTSGTYRRRLRPLLLSALIQWTRTHSLQRCWSLSRLLVGVGTILQHREWP